MKLILHVGLHKTGTTAIQRSLYGFDDGRLRYARLGAPNHTVAMRTLFSPNPYQIVEYRRAGFSEAKVDRLKADLTRRFAKELSQDRETLVVSGEGILGFPKPAFLGLRDFVSPSVSQIQLLAYLRRILSYEASALQERIKNGGMNHTPGLPQLRRRFERAFEVFGRDAMSFSSFEACIERDGSVVNDFRARIGLPPQLGKDRRANESLSMAATQLLYVFNQTGVQSKGTRDLLFARTKLVSFLRETFPEGKFSLPHDLIWAHFSDEGIEGVRWLEEQSGMSLLEARPTGLPSDLTAYDAYMRDVSEEAVEALRVAMSDSGIAFSAGDDLEKLVQNIYAHFVARRFSNYTQRAAGALKRRIGIR